MVPTPLVRPDNFFGERTPELSLGRAVAVVLVVALVTTTVVGAFGWIVSERITATTEIDNPERPPDWVCDDEGDTGTEKTTRDGCGQPKQKTVAVGDLLWDEFSGKLPLVFVSILFGWLVIAVSLHVASALFGGRGSFADTLAVAAWGMVPSAVQALVGFGLLYVALGSIDLAASDPEMLASQVRSLSERAQGNTTLLSLAGACWQGYIWTLGLKHARNLPTGEAAFAGGGVAFVGFLLGLA